MLEDPFPDPDGLEVPPLSPVPPNPLDIAYSRIPADEPLTENYSQEELDEIVSFKFIFLNSHLPDLIFFFFFFFF